MRTTAYKLNEALNTTMTAQEWTTRYAPASLQNALSDEESLFSEITTRAHEPARRLNVQVSPEGTDPPLMWEIEYAENS